MGQEAINRRLENQCMLCMHDVFCHVLWKSSYKYGVFGKFYKYAYCVLCNLASPSQASSAQTHGVVREPWPKHYGNVNRELHRKKQAAGLTKADLGPLCPIDLC
jgi:hypothetical protein